MTAAPHVGHASSMAPRFAPATMDDFETVAVLFHALHTYNTTLDARFALAETWREQLQAQFIRTATDPSALWLIAWDRVHPVGLLLMELHQDSPMFMHHQWAEMTALYVAPRARGTAVAHHLAGYAQRWAAERGNDRVQLYVTATNARARTFYRRTGFRPVQEIWRLEVGPRFDRVAAG